MKLLEKERGSVYFNKGAWQAFNELLNELKSSNIFVIADSNTHKYCLPYFLDRISSNFDHEIVVFNDGEKHKNISTCLNIWEESKCTTSTVGPPVHCGKT